MGMCSTLLYSSVPRYPGLQCIPQETSTNYSSPQTCTTLLSAAFSCTGAALLGNANCGGWGRGGKAGWRGECLGPFFGDSAWDFATANPQMHQFRDSLVAALP